MLRVVVAQFLPLLSCLWKNRSSHLQTRLWVSETSAMLCHYPLVNPAFCSVTDLSSVFTAPLRQRTSSLLQILLAFISNALAPPPPPTPGTEWTCVYALDDVIAVNPKEAVGRCRSFIIAYVQHCYKHKTMSLQLTNPVVLSVHSSRCAPSVSARRRDPRV
jgi:hypothetical protein